MPLLFVTDCSLHVDSPLQKPTYYFSTFKMSKSIKVIGTTNTIKQNVYELQKNCYFMVKHRMVGFTLNLFFLSYRFPLVLCSYVCKIQLILYIDLVSWDLAKLT